MRWIDNLTGLTVGLDTAPLIYFIENHPAYFNNLEPFFQALDQGRFRAVASTLITAEVLVEPYKIGNLLLPAEYKDLLLKSRHLNTVPVSNAIAEEAAKLRAVYRYKTPDSIHLATAIMHGASSFLTNDKELRPPAGLSILCLSSMF